VTIDFIYMEHLMVKVTHKHLRIIMQNDLRTFNFLSSSNNVSIKTNCLLFNKLSIINDYQFC